MQIDGKDVKKVSDTSVGVKIKSTVRENDHVYKKVEINNVGD